MVNMSAELAEAIINQDYTAVTQCIKQGANLNAQDQYGLLPLIQAVIKDNISIAKLLLAHGANVDERDVSGSSALSWATRDNNIPLCKLLLEYGASANLYNSAGEPLLANVRLRDQQDLLTMLVENGANIDFAKDYINAKLIGHRFELTGKADITNHDGKFVEVNFEGFTTEFTIGLICKALTGFINSHIGKKFAEHHHYINKIIEQLVISQNFLPPLYKRKHQAHAEQITPLLQNNFLIVPVTYYGHAMSFVKFGDYLAKCDRGVNNIADTIIVYRAKNPYRLNADLFKQLIFAHNTEHFIHTEIRELLSLEAIASLPTRSQISGNCSWANIEAGVIAALFLLPLPETSVLVSSNNKSKLSTLKKAVIKFYDAWVEWDKDRAVDECIEEFYYTDNEVRRTSKAAILGNILFQRCRPGVSHEVERARKLLSILTIENYKYILHNYTAIYCTPKAGPLGEKFTALLLECGLNLKNLTLKKLVFNNVQKRYQAHANSIISLHKAAARGDIVAVKAMFQHDKLLDVDALDHTGSSALIYAALQGQLEIVKYLVEIQQANINLINDKGNSASQYAAHAGHTAVVKYLQQRSNNTATMQQ